MMRSKGLDPTTRTAFRCPCAAQIARTSTSSVVELPHPESNDARDVRELLAKLDAEP